MESSRPSKSQASRRDTSSIEQLEARIAPATFIVTTGNDAGEGSLRDAIEDANAAEGADEILFAKKVRGKIKLGADLPAITDSVTISGPGAAKLAINAENHQLFSIVGVEIDVKVSGLKLTGGEAENGGAIYVNNPGGTVSLSKTVITKNRAIGPDGDSTAGNGGGLAVIAGTVNVEKSKITGNKAGIVQTFDKYVGGKYISTTVFSAAGHGGGIAVGSEGVVNLKKTVISGNEAAAGGGIHNAGEAVVEERSKISKNLAKGFYSSDAKGGGIFNESGGSITVNESKITGNRAVGEKGASGLYGEVAGTGGAAFGGGIFNATDGDVTLIASKLSGNTAIGGKGGEGATGERGEDAYYTRKGGSGGIGGTGGPGGAAYGGAIANSGVLTIETSKVSGNASIGGAGGAGGVGGTGGRGADGQPADTYYGTPIPAKPPGPGGKGGLGGDGAPGGIGFEGGILSDPDTATTTINNSVVSGNTARDGSFGAKGATGKPGKTGSTGGGDPYYG